MLKHTVIAGLGPAIHLFARSWMRGSEPAHDERRIIRWSCAAIIVAALATMPYGVLAADFFAGKGPTVALASENLQELVRGGAWNFRIEERGHPELSYSKDGKSIFYVGCGRAFGLHAVYPGIPKR